MDKFPSRASGSRTYHVPPARLPVCFLPVSHVSLLYHFGLSTHLCLPFCLTLTSFDSSTRLQSHYLWTYDSFTFYNCLYLYLPTRYIYTIGMRTRSSSSIYFATTLQVRPARSLVLSSSLIARWPRLLLCDLKKEVHFSFSVSRSPVVKSSLRMYFGALITED